MACRWCLPTSDEWHRWSVALLPSRLHGRALQPHHQAMHASWFIRMPYPRRTAFEERSCIHGALAQVRGRACLDPRTTVSSRVALTMAFQ